MGPALVLLGLVAAGAVVTRLVGRASDKWFSDIDSMDQDYPSDRADPNWGSGGGHIGM